MFTIYDGREYFYQWDLDRKLIVYDETIKEVHFCNKTDDCSLVCEVYTEGALRLVNVPNILLQDNWRINVYAYDENYTKYSKTFDVKSRSKPADYIYTEKELLKWEQLEGRLESVEQAQIELENTKGEVKTINDILPDENGNIEINKKNIATPTYITLIPKAILEAHYLKRYTGELVAMGSGDKTYIVKQYDVSKVSTVSITASSNLVNHFYTFTNPTGKVIALSEQAASGAAVSKITNKIVDVPEGATILNVAWTKPGIEANALSLEHNLLADKWANKKWVCIGDSLTVIGTRTSKAYHTYIAEATGINVVNMGASGTGYARGGTNTFYGRIANVPLDADVVTIFGSGNDLSSGLSLGEITDTGTDTLCGCINTAIDNLISIMPTVQLGIVTPTPWVGQQPNAGKPMEKYANAIVDICKARSIPCLDLYHCSNLRPWTEEGRMACYTKDDGNGVHPDETGHKLIAPRFKAFLESLLM